MVADHLSALIILISTVERCNSNLVADGYMNGRLCHLPVDTGATLSVMKSEMFNKVAIRSIKNVSLSGTAKGKNIAVYEDVPVKGTLATLKYKSENNDINHKFIVGLDIMISERLTEPIMSNDTQIRPNNKTIVAAVIVEPGELEATLGEVLTSKCSLDRNTRIVPIEVINHNGNGDPQEMQIIRICQLVIRTAMVKENVPSRNNWTIFKEKAS